jgi:hypothetical protein
MVGTVFPIPFSEGREETPINTEHLSVSLSLMWIEMVSFDPEPSTDVTESDWDKKIGQQPS